MKTIANRLIALAAGAVALGTMAYSQNRNRTIAEIPFAFRTANGVLPAGTYQFGPNLGSGGYYVVTVRDAEKGHTSFAGQAHLDAYKRASGAPSVEFVCDSTGCALHAIRTSEGSLEYAAPHKTKGVETAIVSVPLKTVTAD